MRKLLALCSLLFIFSITTYAQTHIKVSGIASKGGRIVRVSPTVQYKLMETYPACTVSVFLAGTATLATIFSDEGITPKSNPFTSNSLDASFSFYVVPGRYDITFSGTGITSPFTIADFFVAVGTGGGGGAVDSFNGRTGVVIPVAGDYTFSGLDFTGSNFNSIVTRSASDLNAGILPDAVFPATLPALSGINLTNLNATNLASGTVNDARLSSNVVLENITNTFTQINSFTNSLGIGTASPDRKLEVLDGTGAQLRLTSVDASAFADLFVDSGGTLNILPSGNVAFDSVGNQVNPLNNFDQNLGQINKKWLSLHAAELFVETLVAQNTIATIGGRIIVAPTNQLIADLAPAATTINVKYNNFSNGDRLYMEGNSSVEFFAVTSGASVITGGFSYTVTRNLDGTGANQWFAGDAMVNTGVAGNGFIDLYSVRGVKAGTQLGPTIVGNVRNSSTFNDWSENWAIGNLNGIYGYGSDIYGAAFGKYAAGVHHLTVDSTNGIRFFFGLSSIISKWDSTGITIGSTVAGESNAHISSGNISLRAGTTERIKLLSDGSGFLANNLISWDTAGNLTITDANLRLSGASSSFSIGTTPPTSASAGTGIFIDRTGLYGLLSNVLQVKLDATTGAIVSGAGNVQMDVAGIKFLTSASFINWCRASDGFACTTGSATFISVTDGSGEVATTIANTGNATNNQGKLRLQAQNNTTFARPIIDLLGVVSNPQVRIFGGTVTALTGVMIGSDNSPTAMLDIDSDKIRLRTAKTPASATEACNQGTVVWDTNFVYVCVATNTWKRTAIATW